MSDDTYVWKQHSVPVAVDWLPVPDGPGVADMLNRALSDSLDRMLNPWKYPDKNPMPLFCWWPWIDRLLLVRRAPAEVRVRVSAAWSVLRWGPTDHDEDW